MKVVIYLSLLLIGVPFHCCHPAGPLDVQDGLLNPTKSPPDHQHPSSEDECNSPADAWHNVVPSNADFAFRLYKQMTSSQTNKNVLFSPLSISTAFAMLALGAKSETKSQIYKGLAFNLSEIEEREIHRGFCQLIRLFNFPRAQMLMEIGNVLFLEDSLKVLPTFLEDAETFYQAEAIYMSFLNSTAAKKLINDYLKNKTHGRRVDTVRDLSVHTVMVLINYVYFKGYWRKQFYSGITREGDFFACGNRTVRVNFMHKHTNFRFFRDEELSCSVVEIPYSQDSVAWFILPDKGKLKDVESSLVQENLERWRTSFQDRDIKLWLPKFSISSSYDVKDFFERMGVTNVFDSYADLSGITGKHNLRVSEAVHKAMLVVQEDGLLVLSGMPPLVIRVNGFIRRPPPPPPPPPLRIRFNRAFLMLIIDASKGTIILMGKIVNPIDL